MYLQSPRESIPTFTLSSCCIAGSPRPTLAPLQTAFPKGSRWTRILTVSSDEPGEALTRPLHGIAEGPVLALALLTAGRPPVFVVTG